MNDFIKLKKKRAQLEEELENANPYRTKGNQFASKSNYDHLIGDTPVDAAYTETNKRTVNQDRATITGGAKSVFDGIKSLSDAGAKLFEGKKKQNKIYKKYPDISDKELSDKLNRLRLEQQYSDIVGDTKIIKTGSEKAKDALQTIGAIAGVGASIASIVLAIYTFKK